MIIEQTEIVAEKSFREAEATVHRSANSCACFLCRNRLLPKIKSV